jgi:hypothetical protein
MYGLQHIQDKRPLIGKTESGGPRKEFPRKVPDNLDQKTI